MSDFAIDQTKEDVELVAATQNCRVVWPSQHQLALDLDLHNPVWNMLVRGMPAGSVLSITKVMASLCNRKALVADHYFQGGSRLSLEFAHVWQSRGGGVHVLVNTKNEYGLITLPYKDRLWLQTYLYSDPVRDMKSWLQYRHYGRQMNCLFRPLPKLDDAGEAGE